MSQTAISEWVSTTTLQKHLSISRTQLYKLRKEGDLLPRKHFIKVGSYTKWNYREIVETLAALTEKAVADERIEARETFEEISFEGVRD